MAKPKVIQRAAPVTIALIKEKIRGLPMSIEDSVRTERRMLR